MQQPLTLGIAGLGTVGAGLLAPAPRTTRSAWRSGPAGRSASPASRRARKGKKRGVDIGGIPWFDDPVQLATDPADRRVRRADRRLGRRRQGRGRSGAATPASTSSPPTRRCSPSTASRSPSSPRRSSVALNFEAAVAGGIPVIKTLRESLAANEVRRVYGILNGTCNYILTHDGRPSTAPSATC